MGTAPQPPNLISDYLLGRLSEAEQEQLEETYFNDNDVFIELLETEDRLIKDYLLDNLAPDERRLFELSYLTTICKRQKVEFASLMNQPKARELIREKSKAAAQNSSSFWESVFSFLGLKQPALMPLAVAASLLLISIFIWAVKNYSFFQPPSEIARMSTPAPSVPTSGSLAQQIVPLDLTPGSQRSSGNVSSLPTAIISSGQQQIELKLKVAGFVYPKYRGLLQKIDDGVKEITSSDSLKPEKIQNENFVIWRLESTRLPVGDYLVELQGVKPSGDLGDTTSYDFNVRSRESR